MADPGQALEGVEERGGGGPHEIRGLSCHHFAVGQLDGSSGVAGLLGHGAGSGHHRPDGGVHLGLLHQQLQFVHRLVPTAALAPVAQSRVIPPDDLLAGGGADGRVVHNAAARQVNPHIRGGLIGALAGDLLKNGGEDREDLHIPVVVDGGDAVGLEVEGVDHIDVVEVGSGRLIGQVHRMLERQIPDGEGLELGVSSLHSALIFVVELGEAGGHLTAAGAGGGDHHQGA